MHICMVAFSDLRFDYRIFREATSLHRAGHRVSIVASAFDPSPLTDWEGIELDLIPIDRSLSLRRIYPAFWRWARQRLLAVRPDVFHAHDLDVLWPAVRAAKRLDVPVVYDSHELWIDQSSLVGRPAIRSFWTLLERRLIESAHRVIAVSESIARILEDRYRLEEVTVLRNLPLYRPPVESDRIRVELGLAADRPVVLYQGGFLTENGLSEQIEAASDFGPAAFVLIGDGPREAALRQQVCSSDLQDRVFFIPRVPFRELHTYTCSADLGLCLIKNAGRSFYYSMPNKLFEYLMAGLPVLASDFPEMRRVIAETDAGQVADPGDLEAIRTLVCQMLADGDRRQAYRRAALKGGQRFNWEREAGRLTRLYAEL